MFQKKLTYNIIIVLEVNKMEKTGQIIEIIIKLVAAIFSIIAAVLVVRNCFSMFGFLTLGNDEEIKLYDVLSKTQIGKVFSDIGVFIDLNKTVILVGFSSFLNNLEFISIFYFVILLVILLLYFLFVKWSLLKNYINILLIIGASYLLKYIFVLVCLALFNNNNIEGIILSLKIATILYFIISVVEFGCFLLLILKFITNISTDVKYLLKHC